MLRYDCDLMQAAPTAFAKGTVLRQRALLDARARVARVVACIPTCGKFLEQDQQGVPDTETEGKSTSSL